MFVQSFAPDFASTNRFSVNALSCLWLFRLPKAAIVHGVQRFAKKQLSVSVSFLCVTGLAALNLFLPLCSAEVSFFMVLSKQRHQVLWDERPLIRPVC